MASVEGESPPGLSEAADGIAYVQSAVAELTSLERDLPYLLVMEWRSEAAAEFAELLHRCRSALRVTAREFEAAAELLRSYTEDLRLTIGRDG